MSQPKPLKIESRTLALAGLKPHERNYNKHPDSQIADIAESLQQFGLVKPIVVWREFIIAGHGVALAARKLGWDKIEARVLPSAWRESKALAYLAADNELARRGDPDQAQLAAIVKDVADKEGATLAKLAAGDEKALRALLAQANATEETADAGELVDRAAELQKKWRVERGDLWQCGKHRIVCGGCADKETVARLLQGETLRLFSSDPPYGVKYADKNKYLNAVAFGNRVQTPIENDGLNAVELQALWLAAFKSAFDVADAGCPYYINSPQGGDNMMMMMMMMLRESGWLLKPHIIWVKNNHVLGRSDYQLKHEPILYGWKDGAHWFYGDRSQFSVWEFDKPQSSKFHPTMKPVALIVREIENSSKPGEIVGDWFLGSGTTLIACEQTGRIGRGIEIEPKYVAVSLERLSLLGLTPRRVETNGKAKRTK